MQPEATDENAPHQLNTITEEITRDKDLIRGPKPKEITKQTDIDPTAQSNNGEMTYDENKAIQITSVRSGQSMKNYEQELEESQGGEGEI